MDINITSLHIELMEDILGYLTLKDWINFEQVNREWRAYLRRFFDYQITLDIDKIVDDKMEKFLDYIYRYHMRTKFRLVYLGRRHTHMSYRNTLRNVNLRILTVLYIPGWIIDPRDMISIAQCHQLIHICVRVKRTVSCSYFRYIFERNEDLLTVSILDHYCDSNCTKSLPPTCGKLRLGRYKFNKFYIPQNWHTLRCLEINDCNKVPSDLMFKVFEKLRVLTKFSFNFYNKPTRPREQSTEPTKPDKPKLLPIRSMKLLYLINNEIINDFLLSAFVIICYQLRSLHVGSLPFVQHHSPCTPPLKLTVFTFSQISKLRYLLRLCLYNIQEIVAHSLCQLKYCRNLQVLEIVNSKFILNNFVLSVVSNCLDLHCLTILGQKFTSKALQEANKSMDIFREFKLVTGSRVERLLDLTIEEGSFGIETLIRYNDPWVNVTFSSVSAYCDTIWRDIWDSY